MIASLVIAVLRTHEDQHTSTFAQATGQVTRVLIAPKSRIAHIAYESQGTTYAGKTTLMAFTSIRQGQYIDILFNPINREEIIINHPWYRHKLSSSLLLGLVFLAAVIALARWRRSSTEPH